MRLSKASVYAIWTALYLTVKHPKYHVPVQEIAQALNIPFHFLTKIIQNLTKYHITTSVRGPKGGIALAVMPSRVSLLQIIEAMEGPYSLDGCILGLSTCNDEAPCPLHRQWAAMRDELKAFFANTNLADLEKKIKKQGLRITDVCVG